MFGAAIIADRLRYHYGQTKAVDGISFKVGEGEITGFLGPYGAGKTTDRQYADKPTPTPGRTCDLAWRRCGREPLQGEGAEWREFRINRFPEEHCIYQGQKA